MTDFNKYQFWKQETWESNEEYINRIKQYEEEQYQRILEEYRNEKEDREEEESRKKWDDIWRL